MLKETDSNLKWDNIVKLPQDITDITDIDIDGCLWLHISSPFDFQMLTLLPVKSDATVV